MGTRKNLSDCQKKILVYLYKVRHQTADGVSSTVIGKTVGEALKTNEEAQTRDSSWSSPKCKSLTGCDLVEQLEDRTYRITNEGIYYVNKYLLNGYQGLTVVELLEKFAEEVQADMEEIADSIEYSMNKYSDNWIVRIINWVRGLFA